MNIEETHEDIATDRAMGLRGRGRGRGGGRGRGRGRGRGGGRGVSKPTAKEKGKKLMFSDVIWLGDYDGPIDVHNEGAIDLQHEEGQTDLQHEEGPTDLQHDEGPSDLHEEGPTDSHDHVENPEVISSKNSQVDQPVQNAGATIGNEVIVSTQNNDCNNNTQTVIPLAFMKKIPKTTAIRKGLTQHLKTHVTEPQSSNGSQKRAATVSLNPDDDDDSAEHIDSDDDVSFKADEDGGDDSDADSDVNLVNEDLTDEDDEGRLAIFNDDDEYEDDEANYFAKLYKKGELCKDEEFGKIELRP